MMNMRDYGNPEIMLLKKLTCEQNYTSAAAGYNCSINSSSWKGYLTKVAILTIAGFASFYLVNKKVNLSEKGRSCFLALRKYFPKGKDEDEHDSESDANWLDPSYNKYETCPVCLSKLKTGMRASCGHFLCSKCLVKYREIRCTKSPPCPLCRLPLKSVTPAAALDLISGNLFAVKPPSNCESITINEIAIENIKTDSNQVTSSTKTGNNKSEFFIACQSRVSYFFRTLFCTMNDKRNFIARNFFLVFGLTAVLSNTAYEFIRNGNILEFVIPLSLMSIMYAWYFLKVSHNFSKWSSERISPMSS